MLLSKGVTAVSRPVIPSLSVPEQSGRNVNHICYLTPHQKAGACQGTGFFCPASSGAAAEGRRHFFSQITHSGVHPCSRTIFDGKPPVNGQDHLIGLRRICEGLILILHPEELRLSVTPANIRAEPDERPVYRIPERIRLHVVRRALDGNGPLFRGRFPEGRMSWSRCRGRARCRPCRPRRSRWPLLQSPHTGRSRGPRHIPRLRSASAPPR